MSKQLIQLGSVLAAVALIVSGSWFAFDTKATADEASATAAANEKRAEVLEDAVLELKAIHAQQQAVTDAKREQLADLCRRGLISDPKVCGAPAAGPRRPAVSATPATTATAPAVSAPGRPAAAPTPEGE